LLLVANNGVSCSFDDSGYKALQRKQSKIMDSGCYLSERAGLELAKDSMAIPADFEVRPPYRGTFSSVVIY